MNIKWYPLLVSSKKKLDSTKDSRSLLSYENPEIDCIIISQVINDRHKFGKFNNICTFCSFLQKKVKYSHRCFFEYIFSDMPPKTIFRY